MKYLFVLIVFMICVFILIAMILVFYNKDRETLLVMSTKIELDKIYYINLDRRPDRKQHILKQFDDERIPFDKIVRFKGIDGKTHRFTEQELYMFKDAKFKNEPNKHFLMGNQLSHYYILKDMIEKNYDYILVLQDDVVFKKDFNNHLEKVLSNFPINAEMVNIGFHKYALFENFEPVELENPDENKARCKQECNDHVCYWGDDMNPCSLAYIVTLEGAKNITKHFETVGFLDATDHNYNGYLRFKNIFYGSKIILCTGALMGSNIFGSGALT